MDYHVQWWGQKGRGGAASCRGRVSVSGLSLSLMHSHSMYAHDGQVATTHSQEAAGLWCLFQKSGPRRGKREYTYIWGAKMRARGHVCARRIDRSLTYSQLISRAFEYWQRQKGKKQTDEWQAWMQVPSACADRAGG